MPREWEACQGVRAATHVRILPRLSHVIHFMSDYMLVIHYHLHFSLLIHIVRADEPVARSNILTLSLCEQCLSAV